MRDIEQIVKAASIAALAHAGQRRKGIDEPFILHPMRVAVAAEECGLSANAVAASYLHDVPEDTTVTLDDLIRVGFHGETIALVKTLTKWWSDDFVLTPEGLKEALRPKDVHRRIAEEFKPAYYAKIMQEPEAVALKLLDRADNLHDMVRSLKAEPSWARRYARKTAEEFGEMLHACNNIRVVSRFSEALKNLDAAIASA